MPDIKQIRKLAKKALHDQNPALASHQELVEANDHLGDIKDHLQEMVKQKSDYGVDDLSKFLTTLKGPKGDKGDPGYTPQKGVDYADGKTPQRGIDYLHPQDMEYLKNSVITSEILRKATPIKGVHYRDGHDGQNGVDGKEGKRGPKGKDGYTPVKNVDYFDGKDGKSTSPKEVIEALKKLPEKDKLDFKHFKDGSRLERVVGRIDQRYHGAGVTKVIAGSGITVTSGSPAATGLGDVTISANGSGSGITRIISSIAVDTNAAAVAGTDYVYLCSNTITLTLPTAVGNTNLYTVKNVGSGIVTVATTGGQTIDGGSTALLKVQYTSVDLISDGSNWRVT